MIDKSVKLVATWAMVAAWWLAAAHAGAAVPDDFPRFVVPGKEHEMESLRALFWLHFEPARPLVPLWDEWMPNATLWPARGQGAALDAMRKMWRRALAGRMMNDEGYIHTEQHDGLGHSEGWPFPLWTQAGGIGWHFRGTGVAGYDAPLVSPDGWKLDRAMGGAVNDQGWPIEFSEADATAQTPPFAVEARRAPWLRLNWWAVGLDGAKCYVEWTTQDQPEFSPERRLYFAPPAADPDQSRKETRTMIRVHRHAGWTGVITSLRIRFGNAGPGRVVVKSFHTACDTRHNVNNLNFIRGCHDYVLWTGDLEFQRDQIGRIRAAMRFVEREFRPREKKCIYTTWPGHEGRSGVRWVDGQKVVVPGEGVGSNYWDLLPFGGEDALATVYYYDTLGDLAAIEEIVAAHPEWNVPADGAYDRADLRRHAQEVKDYFGKRFWNEATGRFGTVDLDGQLHDYGFTFLNNEAVVLGIATPAHAKSIYEWMSGTRTVAGDTATGADIYHWRFGPRSTTRRNVDYYFWAWSNPEAIPWGYQVQDGGAVLGWSYYDLMTRLKTAGPDDAAARLAEIATWFDETQAEGGYRTYYGKDPARGTMQGGNVAGGFGLDKEFFESVLVPQVMLYGFLGFRPTLDGFAIDPQLPSDWPELTITRIHLHDYVLDVTATRDGGLKIAGTGPADKPLMIHAPGTVRLKLVEGVAAEIATTAPGSAGG
jgi:hypothetical protein